MVTIDQGQHWFIHRLPEPMLTYHQRCSVSCTSAVLQGFLMNISKDYTFDITTTSPRSSELTWPFASCSCLHIGYNCASHATFLPHFDGFCKETTLLMEALWPLWLTEISQTSIGIRAWISNYSCIYKWDLITQTCPNFSSFALTTQQAITWTNDDTNLWCHMVEPGLKDLGRQAPSHYLSQCWLRSMSPYGIPWPHWVNKDCCFFNSHPTQRPILENSFVEPMLTQIYVTIWHP